jgi:TetR/AcrR family transcriptional repressor of bet genes
MTQTGVRDKPRIRETKKARHRLQIIEATIDSIARFGYAGTTVSTVIQLAGLSRGMVNLHFDTKEDLFVEVLRHLFGQYRQCWETAVDGAGPGARDKLTTMIDADLSPAVLNRRTMAVWSAFRAETNSHPNYLELYDSRDQVRSRLTESLCRDLAGKSGSEKDPYETAYGLNVMLEGFWTDFFLHPEDFDRACARRICLSYLDAQYPPQALSR